ncbi:MAG: methyltransferase domain-containing protein [Jiangellaceae bacterium]|nr:methyltransferase domain-containing protein [Jiangellaceae bacterium]
MVDDPDPTRRSYDAIADQYAVNVGAELAGKPVDRALYRLFAELVGPTGVVADVGCGPGHVTEYLASLGLTVVGVDKSPRMIAVAKRRYPKRRFVVGTFDALHAADAEWSGAVAPYSIIHLNADGCRAAFRELARAIRPGGWLLVAFHIEDAENPPGSVAHLTEWWGTEVALDFHFLDPAVVCAEVEAAGFVLMSRTDRAPWPGVEHQSRRSYLLAQRVSR